MNLSPRIKLGIVAGGIIVFFVGILFFYLNRANERFNDTSNNLPTNDGFEILSEDGNLEVFDQSGFAVEPSEATSSVLRRIINSPVAGYQIISNDNSYRLRYIESNTGYVFDYYPSDGTSVRLTNTSLTRITQATWLGEDRVFITYHTPEQSVNYLAEVDYETGSLTGQIFPSEITSITTTDGDQIYYLVTDDVGSSLYEYNPSTQRSRFKFAFDINGLELINNQNDPSILYAVTKPNPNGGSQIIYEVNPETNLSELISTSSETAGALVAGEYVVHFGEDSEIYNLASDETLTINQTGLASKKCQETTNVVNSREIICSRSTVDPVSNWPFDWFKGRLRPSEQLVSIDLSFGDSFTVVDLSNLYDASQIQVTPDYIYFVSRRTGYLHEVFRGTAF
jgi:hypothetical protein